MGLYVNNLCCISQSWKSEVLHVVLKWQIHKQRTATNPSDAYYTESWTPNSGRLGLASRDESDLCSDSMCLALMKLLAPEQNQKVWKSFFSYGQLRLNMQGPSFQKHKATCLLLQCKRVLAKMLDPMDVSLLLLSHYKGFLGQQVKLHPFRITLEN